MLQCCSLYFFFFNDTATTEIYTLSLHDALPISSRPRTTSAQLMKSMRSAMPTPLRRGPVPGAPGSALRPSQDARSEEHTSELQSRQYLVCRLLLEKKKKYT